MIGLIGLFIFTAFVILGVHAATREDMIFSKLGVYIKEQKQLDNYEEFQDLQLKALQEDFNEQVKEVREDKDVLFLVDSYLKELQSIETQSDQSEIQAIKDKLEQKKNKWYWKLFSPIRKPLTECPTCMSSIWGLSIYALSYAGLLANTLAAAPFFVLATAGFIYFLGKLNNGH